MWNKCVKQLEHLIWCGKHIKIVGFGISIQKIFKFELLGFFCNLFIRPGTCCEENREGGVLVQKQEKDRGLGAKCQIWIWIWCFLTGVEPSHGDWRRGPGCAGADGARAADDWAWEVTDGWTRHRAVKINKRWHLPPLGIKLGSPRRQRKSQAIVLKRWLW